MSPAEAAALVARMESRGLISRKPEPPKAARKGGRRIPSRTWLHRMQDGHGLPPRFSKKPHTTPTP